MAEETLTFHLEGKTTSIDDLTLGELEWLEEELGDTLDKVDFSSIKAAVRIVCILKRRDNPKFTLDQARKLKLSIFDEAEPQNGNGKERPTPAAKGGKSAGGRRTSRSS